MSERDQRDPRHAGGPADPASAPAPDEAASADPAPGPGSVDDTVTGEAPALRPEGPTPGSVRGAAGDPASARAPDASTQAAGGSPRAPDASPPGGPGLSRRDLLRAGAFGAVGLAAGGGALAGRGAPAQPADGLDHLHAMGTGGEVDLSRFDPTDFLTDFDYGRTSTLPGGQTLREYEIVATDRRIEVAPGVFFEGWTYNDQVPGPTIRCTEGDRIRVHFANAGSHPHTIHFHGIHAADMDGVFEVVRPGESFVYEFEAGPAGLHLYHCHAVPLKRHIHKGLYGTFIVDPADRELEPAREMVMVMNAFDTDFDGDNEVYACNTVAFHYQRHPIEIERGELVRVYLVNVTEFDLLNSFHLHGNFFRYWPTGTRPDQWEWTDTVMLCQGERGILEFTYDHTGPFMFHAHQSEFAELGWMGIFDVKEPTIA